MEVVMKICVLGNGILANDFKRLDYVVLDKDFQDFRIEYILNYDVIINTYDYGNIEGENNIHDMKKCNVDMPFLLSEYCNVRNKRYVHISTAKLYTIKESECIETDDICASSPYTATKLLGESGCNKKDLIIRSVNYFNDICSKDNALFNAIINPKPVKNLESFSWTVDVIRGIVALLRSKQKGVYNIASSGVCSQAEICSKLGLTNVAPTFGDVKDKYVEVGLDKLTRHIIPMDIMDNIPKCFESLKNDLSN
jgi:dTDP-4-dehydrorhamnose reductase